MLAAEELRHPQAGDHAEAERPQEQRRPNGVEGHHDARRHAAGCPDMALPEIEKVVALVGGCQGLRAFQRPPMRVRRRHVVESLQPRDTAVDGGRNPASAGGERRATTFMGETWSDGAVKVTLVIGSQTFIDKRLE